MSLLLPAGKTCGDCGYAQRCIALGLTKRDRTACDFSPSRFVEAPKSKK